MTVPSYPKKPFLGMNKLIPAKYFLRRVPSPHWMTIAGHRFERVILGQWEKNRLCATGFLILRDPLLTRVQLSIIVDSGSTVRLFAALAHRSEQRMFFTGPGRA